MDGKVDLKSMSPETKWMLFEVGKDGITETEAKKLGLTQKEAEALYAGLCGEIKENNDGWDGKTNPYEMPKPQESSILGGLLALATALGALFGLSSCGNTYNIELPKIQIIQQTIVNLKFENKALEQLLMDIAELLAEIKEDVEYNFDKLVNILTDILTTVGDLGEDVSKVITLLEKLGVKQDQILKALAEIKDQGQQSLDNQDAILNELANGNEKFAEYLNKILEAIKANGELTKENGELLNQILDKLATIGSSDPKALELLEQILAKVTENVEATKDGNKTNAENDAITHKFLQALLDKLGELSGENKELLTKLLEAINKNTEVAEGTYNVALKILDSLGKLNGKADKAIDVLSKLSVGDTNIDLEDLKEFLKVSFESMINAYTGGNEKVLAKLQEILDKIPNCEGCKCDLTELLAKLDIIIQKLENTDEGNHEGILDDLDDILK